MKNQLSKVNLSGLPNGFTVSYDGNTYPMPDQGDFADAIGEIFDRNGMPSDTHIVVTAPNGDTLKVGPDQNDSDVAAVDARGTAWVSEEMLKFAQHPARRTMRNRQKAQVAA